MGVEKECWVGSFHAIKINYWISARGSEQRALTDGIGSSICQVEPWLEREGKRRRPVPSPETAPISATKRHAATADVYLRTVEGGPTRQRAAIRD